jgi:hypothetical protein
LIVPGTAGFADCASATGAHKVARESKSAFNLGIVILYLSVY